MVVGGKGFPGYKVFVPGPARIKKVTGVFGQNKFWAGISVSDCMYVRGNLELIPRFPVRDVPIDH